MAGCFCVAFICYLTFFFFFKVENKQYIYMGQSKLDLVLIYYILQPRKLGYKISVQ